MESRAGGAIRSSLGGGGGGLKTLARGLSGQGLDDLVTKALVHHSLPPSPYQRISTLQPLPYQMEKKNMSGAQAQIENMDTVSRSEPNPQ